MSISNLKALLDEDWSPEVIAHIESMPPDVRAVVMDFQKDYRAAIVNFKEAYLSAFSWAMQARDELSMLKSYLEAERMRGELGLVKNEQTEISGQGPIPPDASRSDEAQTKGI